LSTYESKKDHFKRLIIGNPYQLGRSRCYLLCRRRVNKFYDLTEEEAVLTIDSDRRCSMKVVTKEKEVHKMVKYSLIFPAIPELKS
jgi:hypothetical protein